MSMRKSLIEQAKSKGTECRLALRVVERMIPEGKLLDVVTALQNAHFGMLTSAEQSLLQTHGLYMHGNLTAAGEQLASMTVKAA